jgi:LacI family transcriptional regulator
MKLKVSLTDIAKELNVSTALVSLVLRDKWKENRISKELAKKVYETAEKLGYKPNVVAQSLRTGRTGIIGLIIADISNPFYSKIARIIEDEAELLGYEVMFGSSEEKLEKFIKVGETLISRQVDGLIVVPVFDSKEILLEWKKRNIPIVTIDRFFSELEIPYVGSDNYRGSWLITDFLLHKNYRKIAFISNDSELSNFKERENGFWDAVKNNSFDIQSHTIYKISVNNWKYELRNVIASLLNNNTDAIYFGQNMLGIEGLRVFKEMNIQFPNRISIVCYDNPEIFELYKPGITCYEQPILEIAKDAISVLVRQLSEKTVLHKYNKRFEGQLIIRESCK